MPDLVQDVDAITKSSENIAFIRSLIEKHAVANKRKNDLLRQLRLAERRMSDRVLRVAILGEFSSGKSTFINALLGQRLLKSARVATTASATYVTYGPKLKVTATFADGRCIQSVALDTAQLSSALAQIRTGLPEGINIREAIDLLTADQSIADAVHRVEIALPSQVLRQGVSIIDTPGIGAGGSHTQTHMRITQSVIKESADAVIVLIPTAQPMSNTLVTFLQESVSHCLHRCIFVMTSMDTQTQPERQKIWSFVTRCFIEKLGLLNPKLYDCAAITALPMSEKAAAYQQTDRTTWQQQFVKLKPVLFREIVRQRDLVIAEKLVYLLQSLLREIKADMQQRQQTEKDNEYEDQEQSLMETAQDIDYDLSELARRQRQLSALTIKLKMA